MPWSQPKQALSPKRRFSRDVLYNVASVGVLALCGIGINIVIAASRGPAALGAFNQVYALYGLLSQIAAAGIHISVLKHVSHSPADCDECADLVSAALMLCGLLAGLVCAAAFLMRHCVARLLESPEVGAGLGFAIPGLFFFSLNKNLLNVLNGARHMRAFAVFASLRFILILGAVVGIAAWPLPSTAFPLAFTIAETGLFVCLLAYVTLRLYPLRLSRGAKGWFGKHLSFGLRGCLSGILNDLSTRVDVLMLGYFCADRTVGIYSFAAMAAAGLVQLTGAVQRNVNPIIGGCFARGEGSKVENLAQEIRRTIYPVMALVGAAAVLAYPVVLRLFVSNPEFAASWAVFSILVAGIVLCSGFAPMAGALIQGGRPGSHTLLMGTTVAANVLLNAALIPAFHIYGAAAATAAANLFKVLFFVFLAKRLLDIKLWKL